MTPTSSINLIFYAWTGVVGYDFFLMVASVIVIACFLFAILDNFM